MQNLYDIALHGLMHLHRDGNKSTCFRYIRPTKMFLDSNDMFTLVIDKAWVSRTATWNMTCTWSIWMIKYFSPTRKEVAKLLVPTSFHFPPPPVLNRFTSSPIKSPDRIPRTPWSFSTSGSPLSHRPAFFCSALNGPLESTATTVVQRLKGFDKYFPPPTSCFTVQSTKGYRGIGTLTFPRKVHWLSFFFFWSASKLPLTITINLPQMSSRAPGASAACLSRLSCREKKINSSHIVRWPPNNLLNSTLTFIWCPLCSFPGVTKTALVLTHGQWVPIREQQRHFANNFLDSFPDDFLYPGKDASETPLNV